jgi:hypothetical protein
MMNWEYKQRLKHPIIFQRATNASKLQGERKLDIGESEERGARPHILLSSNQDPNHNSQQDFEISLEERTRHGTHNLQTEELVELFLWSWVVSSTTRS